MSVFYYLLFVFEVKSNRLPFFPRKVVIFSLYFHFHRALQIVQAGKQVEKFQLLEMKVFQLPIALRTEVNNLTD